MKFEIIISKIPSAGDKLTGNGNPTKTFAMEGNLDAVKTYIKLLNDDKFNWGAVTRVDSLTLGDVDRWLIQKNKTTGELYMSAFSFFDVDSEININTMRQSFNSKTGEMTTLDKALGGGVI